MDMTTIILAGLFGTSLMLFTMSMIHRLGWANADMVRAIGSLFTYSFEGSFVPGILVHYAAGICFASAYTFLVLISPVTSAGGVLFLSMLISLAHGILMGLILTIAVAEYHPLERFRRVGMEVVLAHVVGHVAYGIGVGLVLGAALQGLPVWLEWPSGLFWVLLAGGLLFGAPMLFAAQEMLEAKRDWFEDYLATHKAKNGTDQQQSQIRGARPGKKGGRADKPAA